MSALDDLLEQGLDISGYGTGSHRLPCPACAKGSKDDTFGLTVEPGGAAVWHCHRCHLKGAIRGRDEQPFRPRPPALKQAPPPAPIDRDRLAQALAIYRNSWPIMAEDAAGCYLKARRCLIPPADSHLRWVDHHRHPSGWSGPCLVALATDAQTGDPRTIHRTWIDPDTPGQKAPIDKFRLLFGGLPKAGAVVRLFPDEDVLEGLAIGEGIETCLVAAHGFTPIWSTLDVGNMASFPVLPGVESLTIVADHDPAGLRAAEQCARQWRAAGREVRRWYSSVPGEDAIDFLARVA